MRHVFFLLLAGVFALAAHPASATTAPQRQVPRGRVAAGYYHTLAVTANGQLFAWGRNSSGQIGNGGTTANVTTPVRIGTASNWAQVAAGGSYSLALTADGQLFTWGQDNAGQLGNGAATGNVTAPVRIGTASNWTQVAAGSTHALALTADGQLFAWGFNFYGGVGSGPVMSSVTAPVRIGTASNWVQVAAGQYHSLALTADGQLFAWGRDNNGQLGNGAGSDDVLEPVRIGTANNWVQVAAGHNHSLALTADGQLFAWGDDTAGQTGNGASSADVPEPVRIGTASNWVQVTAGEYHSLALTADGQLFAWGLDNSGQLGNGAGTAVVPTPTRIGTIANGTQVAAASLSSLALLADGQLLSWGDDTYDQLGNGATTDAADAPAPVTAFPSGNRGYVQTASGYTHSLAVRADGQLFAWGGDADGQLGNGAATADTPDPAHIGTGSSWAQVAAGKSHSLAVRADGQLFAWGSDEFGQLGNGATTGSVPEPVRIGAASNWVQVAAGANHSLALTADGQLFGWGNDASGQVGNGAGTANVLAPVRIGTASNWVQVVAGQNHSLALTADGQLFAWGADADGQTGNGATTGSVLAPVRIGAASNWVQVAAGQYHSLALTADGQLFAWGDDTHDQLGNGATTGDVAAPVRIGTASSWTQVAAGQYLSLALTADGQLFAWGADTYGQTGNGAMGGDVPEPMREATTGTTWTRLGLGGTSSHSLALNAAGEVRSAGYNSNGQLGDGTLTNAPTFDRNLAPLPVELTAFTAESQGPDALLRWATASEKNNARFEVEASVDGRTFTKRGQLAGHGSTTQPHVYAFADPGLARYAAPLVYYRLRQVDADGSFSYSPVRTVALSTREAAAPRLTVYPTVAEAGQPLRYAYAGPALTTGTTLEVHDLLGRVRWQATDGAAVGELALPGLPAGWYVLRLRTAAGSSWQARFYRP